MLSGGEPAPCRLDADEPDILSSDKRVERPYCVRSCADAGHDSVGVPAETLAALGLYLRTYNGLEIAHDPGVRRGADDATYDVVGVFDVRDPVPYRLVDGVFEGTRAAQYGHDLGPKELHPHDVQPLAAGVFFAHVDDALLAVEGGDGGRGDAVLARAGLGDDALLAHPVGEENLAQGVVDLVRAGVREVLALEPDVGAAPPLGQALGEHKRGRPADEVPRQAVPLLAELGVVAVALVGLFELFEGVDQGLGHVAAPEWAEVTLFSLLPQGRTSAPARHSSCLAHPPGNSTRRPRRARKTRSPLARSPGRARRRRRCYHVRLSTSLPPSRTARPCLPAPYHCVHRGGTGRPRMRPTPRGRRRPLPAAPS